MPFSILNLSDDLSVYPIVPIYLQHQVFCQFFLHPNFLYYKKLYKGANW